MKWYASTDHGLTWTHRSTHESHITNYPTHTLTLPDNIIISPVNTLEDGTIKIFRSIDNGYTWTMVQQYLWDGDGDRNLPVVCAGTTYNRNSAVLVGEFRSISDGPKCQLVRSTDYGATWTYGPTLYTPDLSAYPWSIVNLGAGKFVVGNDGGFTLQFPAPENGKFSLSSTYGVSWTLSNQASVPTWPATNGINDASDSPPYFEVSGNWLTRYPSGVHFVVTGSAHNNGSFISNGASLVLGKTRISTSPVTADHTPSGIITTQQPGRLRFWGLAAITQNILVSGAEPFDQTGPQTPPIYYSADAGTNWTKLSTGDITDWAEGPFPGYGGDMHRMSKDGCLLGFGNPGNTFDIPYRLSLNQGVTYPIHTTVVSGTVPQFPGNAGQIVVARNGRIIAPVFGTTGSTVRHQIWTGEMICT